MIGRESVALNGSVLRLIKPKEEWVGTLVREISEVWT